MKTITETSLNFAEELKGDSKITLSFDEEENGPLYYITYDRETNLFQVDFERNENDYIPSLNDEMNFMFFYNYHKQSKKMQSADCLVLKVDEFFSAIQSDKIHNDDSYILMRWNSGYEKWTASKFNKYKAFEFLKAYVFIN